VGNGLPLPTDPGFLCTDSAGRAGGATRTGSAGRTARAGSADDDAHAEIADGVGVVLIVFLNGQSLNE